MLNIAIDLGSYSNKYIVFKSDKKRIKIISTDESILDIPEDTVLTDEELWDLQIQNAGEFIQGIEGEFQIIMRMSSEIISTRYLSLPIKNRKKVMQMLPFQIEEDLPFSLSDCHYAEKISLQDQTSNILAGIVKVDHFESFYNQLRFNQVHPQILTYDISHYSSYVSQNIEDFPKAFAILEFGHDATRGYFFHNGQLVANHHSFVAGKIITEDISKTYSISIEEATIYKHQNSFVLTEDQFDHVNQNQKEFAKLMDNSIQPLINEIRRWEIGFRVQHGLAIEEFHICGGTSNINNFENYLSQKLNTKIEYFNPYQNIKDEQVDQDKRIRNKFSPAINLAQGMTMKNQMINFLKGNYSFKGTSSLPLENIAFIGVRLSILAFFICTYLLIDNYKVNSKSKAALRHLQTKVFKNQQAYIFKLKTIDKNKGLRDRPKTVLNKVVKAQNIVKQEIKMVQAAAKINALSPLNEIVSLLAGADVEIIQFKSLNGEDFNLVIKAKDEAQLNMIADQVESSSLYDIETEKDTGKMLLTVNGEED